MTTPAFTLHRDAWARLVLVDAAGTEHVGVTPVRAFPIAAPDEGLSIMGADGHELAWVDRLSALPADLRALVEDELANREFMPEVLRVKSVSSYVTPCTFVVETDRGETSFVLRGEEHIRRLPGASLLISDEHGLQFHVRDLRRLDRASRTMLDRFL